jgi:hypothetical protein
VNLQHHDEAIPPMWSYNTTTKQQQCEAIAAPQYNNNGKQQHQHNTVAPMHKVANQCKATK